MPYHYSSNPGPNLKANFHFFRFRFHFTARDAVHFPVGKSGNVIRGALGRILRDTASPAAYARLFEPGSALGRAPSGLGDWPRPFILRASGLDGQIIPAGSPFCFDVHIFDTRPAVLQYFHQAFEQLGGQGIGPGHGRVTMCRGEQLDLDDRSGPADATAPLTIDLTPGRDPVDRVHLTFLTPTELKSGGMVTERPEFPTLFARLRDRISTLRALYGEGPLEIDFRAMGERAGAVRMTGCDVQWEKVERGSAEYEGELAEFVPWLRAARWVGVGRQTVWGKGDVRVG
jgi:hypothetical protein